MRTRHNPDDDLRRLRRQAEATKEPADIEAYYAALRRIGRATPRGETAHQEAKERHARRKWFRALRPRLRRVVGENGELPSYAWPGGYPILYTSQGDTVCPDCANDIDDPQTAADLDGYFIHYEGLPEFCGGCNKEIESAYGDPDAEEEEDTEDAEDADSDEEDEDAE